MAGDIYDDGLLGPGGLQWYDESVQQGEPHWATYHDPGRTNLAGMVAYRLAATTTGERAAWVWATWAPDESLSEQEGYAESRGGAMLAAARALEVLRG